MFHIFTYQCYNYPLWRHISWKVWFIHFNVCCCNGCSCYWVNVNKSKKMVSLVAKIIFMSKFLGSRSNVWHLYWRYQDFQKIPHKILPKVTIESHRFIYSTLDLLNMMLLPWLIFYIIIIEILCNVLVRTLPCLKNTVKSRVEARLG